MDAAWQKVNNACNVANRTSLTPAALATGHADALGMAVNSLQRLPTDRERLPGARQLLLRHTTATGTDAQIIQWYNQNKNNLVFDPATAKFRIAGS